MLKGVAVSCEHGDDTFTTSLVFLETKTLKILNFEVIPVKDGELNWALNNYQSPESQRFNRIQKLDSQSIREHVSLFLADIDFYFVRDSLTLEILTDIFKIAKTRIYVINKIMSGVQGVFCLSCGNQRECCSIYDVVAMANLICNLQKDCIPKDLSVAAAQADFKFAADPRVYPVRYALKTADIEKCARFNTQTACSSDSE
jgi:hypothetical protein